MKPRLPISRLRAEEFDAVLDAALQPESDRLVPSSGFTESVMSAVRAEAAAPPPIPFPWMRALPGIAAASDVGRGRGRSLHDQVHQWS